MRQPANACAPCPSECNCAWPELTRRQLRSRYARASTDPGRSSFSRQAASKCHASFSAKKSGPPPPRFRAGCVPRRWLPSGDRRALKSAATSCCPLTRNHISVTYLGRICGRDCSHEDDRYYLRSRDQSPRRLNACRPLQLQSKKLPRMVRASGQVPPSLPTTEKERNR